MYKILRVIRKLVLAFRQFTYRSRLVSRGSSTSQINLMMTYKLLAAQSSSKLPTFREVGFQQFSGSDEDGILLYIFALIGVNHKTVIDIGAGGINGSNSANLIINHGWSGILMDARQNGLDEFDKLYTSIPNVRTNPPTTVRGFVSSDNINELISSHGLSGDIDLLSIDIDGVDYWIWDALSVVEPRVVIVEYQPALGLEQSLTIPNTSAFTRNVSELNQNPSEIPYAGASLAAFVKLGRKKGYRLVGCNEHGFNAFFVKDGLGEDVLPEIPAASCDGRNYALRLQEKYGDAITSLNWQTV